MDGYIDYVLSFFGMVIFQGRTVKLPGGRRKKAGENSRKAVLLLMATRNPAFRNARGEVGS